MSSVFNSFPLPLELNLNVIKWAYNTLHDLLLISPVSSLTNLILTFHSPAILNLFQFHKQALFHLASELNLMLLFSKSIILFITTPCD